jgi:hypothetical protein
VRFLYSSTWEYTPTSYLRIGARAYVRGRAHVRPPRGRFRDVWIAVELDTVVTLHRCCAINWAALNDFNEGGMEDEQRVSSIDVLYFVVVL